MSKLDHITKESWMLNNCPEWGTWLNEEIENEIVEENRIAMWWLGCVGLWLKTPANANICIDFWCGTGKRTKKLPLVNPSHQMARMSGTRIPQPNLRNSPFVLDPFAITQIDAVLATHFHSDHIDINVAAAVIKNCDKNVPFIGPQACVDIWTEWGVPLERCIVMKPGDSVKIKDIEILALESSDRTSLITDLPVPHDEPNQIPEMDLRSINYLIKTPGGNIYHSGDSHYSNLFAKHGKKYAVDVALGSFGENPIGIVDKMTSIDILRMGEALRCQVIIPVHHDVWTNMLADPNEILSLYEMRKYRLRYKFKPFIWQPGGKFIFPDDKDAMVYQHSRGFPDLFEYEAEVPFPSFL